MFGSCSCSWTCTGQFVALHFTLRHRPCHRPSPIAIMRAAIANVFRREKLDAVRSQLQSSQAQHALEKAELKSALDSAEEKLRQLSGLEQQLGSIITDAAAAGADVQPFTDVLQAAALGSKGRVAQVPRTALLLRFIIILRGRGGGGLR